MENVECGGTGGGIIMNMKELMVLSEIVNYQSFSDAAFSLSYSPSVVTKYVSNVEKELGIKLFVRGNRSNEMSLTTEGRILMQDIQRIIIHYQHMQEMVKQLKGTYDNILRVGSQARIGNQVEQEILASFLLKNNKVDLEHVRLNARDLIRLLQSGKLDAAIMSIHANAEIEDLFNETGDYSDVDIVRLATERDMYLGIAEHYLPLVEKEASFAEFRDFSFAFSFPSSTDEEDAKAIESFRLLARKYGFELNAAYFGAHDSTILKLATKMPVAVTTTCVPAQYKGIKFIRVNDWPYHTNVYFVCMKNNNKKTLLNLKKTAIEFRKQTNISTNKSF